MVTFRYQQGVAYLWMLFLVFLLGLGLGKCLEVYSASVQREKEAELIYVGGLYRNAIKQYYLSSPGSLKKYPLRLADLLKDPRSLATRRYLRQLYLDPVSGKAFVPLWAPEGGIYGVRSASAKHPLRVAGLEDLTGGRVVHGATYQDWEFVYLGAGN